MITLQRPRVASISGRYLEMKYTLDLLLAVLLLILFAPLLLLIALVVRLDSRGPAIYRQLRIGAGGKPFTIFKFRTMRIDAPVLSTEEMQRQRIIPFTRLGPFLRKSSLDELPQLFNIVRGEMSFIGPRPALPSQDVVNTLRRVSGADALRPGITGQAQVMGRDDLDDETKVAHDTEYSRVVSFRLDAKLLWLTFVAVFSARGNK